MDLSDLQAARLVKSQALASVGGRAVDFFFFFFFSLKKADVTPLSTDLRPIAPPAPLPRPYAGATLCGRRQARCVCTYSDAETRRWARATPPGSVVRPLPALLPSPALSSTRASTSAAINYMKSGDPPAVPASNPITADGVTVPLAASFELRRAAAAAKGAAVGEGAGMDRQAAARLKKLDQRACIKDGNAVKAKK